MDELVDQRERGEPLQCDGESRHGDKSWPSASSGGGGGEGRGEHLVEPREHVCTLELGGEVQTHRWVRCLFELLEG